MKGGLIKLSLTVLLLSSLAIPQVFSDSLSNQVMAQEQTVIIRPNGPGSETGLDYQWPTLIGGHWDKVDDESSDGDTTYVANAAGGDAEWQRDLYAIESPGTPDGMVTRVTVYFRTRHNASAVKPCIRTHDTVYEGNLFSQAYWKTNSQTWINNPFTGAAWTWQEVEDLEVGITMDGSQANPDWADCTQVYVVVYHTSAPTDQRTLRPIGAGSITEIDTQVPSTGAHWDKVDEATADDATTYLSNDTGVIADEARLTDLFEIEDPTNVSGTVESVTVYVRSRHNASNAWAAVKTHGTIYETPDNEKFSQAEWRTNSTTWATNPYTGQPWTWQEVNDLEAGVSLDGSIASPDWADCTQIYVVVDYTIGAVAEFDWSPQFPEPFDEIIFDASPSCSSGEILSYNWDFGDNTYTTGEIVTHYYQKADEYTVTLTIVDSNNCTATISKDIIVGHWLLFEKYAPVLYLHDEELFRTREVSSMLDISDLTAGVVLLEEGPITIEDLREHDSWIYQLDMWDARSDQLLSAVPPIFFWDVPSSDNFSQFELTVYGREKEYDDVIALQYWFFYPYNNWKNHHEGDWEMITVFVDKSTGSPYRVACAQHLDGSNYNWEEDVGKVPYTQHPKIFIARGSHSSWGGIGVHKGWLGTDVTSDTGTVLHPEGVDPGGTNPKQLYTLEKIRLATRWVMWQGHWGEDTTWPFSEGPRSPTLQGDKWEDPLAWSNGLSYSKYVAQTGSPVDLHAYDQYGNHVGINEAGEIEYEIPGTYIYVPSAEGEEVMIIYTEEDLHFEIEATGAGDFDFDIGRYIKAEDKEIVAEYDDVAITENTTAILEVSPDNPQYIMEIDLDGNGTVDEYKEPDSLIGVNEPPEADANGPYVGEEGSPLTFDASDSTDPDGDPLQYRWDFNGNGTWDTDWLETATANYTWGDDFTGTAILEVSDAEFTDSDNTSVTVNNVAPIAEAGPDQTVEVFDLVSFNGSFSDAGWLDTHTFEWDFGDDTTATGENVTHAYNLTGSYTVTLTVTDDDGGVGVDTTEVTVIQTYGVWANSSSDSDAIDWSGSNMNVTGKAHSNNDIKVSGSNNTIDGVTSYVASFNDSGSDNSYTPPPSQGEVKPLPVQYDLADYQPDGSEALAAQAEGKYHYIDGDFEVSDSGVVLDGLYYITGEVKLSGSNISGQFTIVAEGDISQDISGSEFDCRSYSGDLLFLCNGSLLKIAGSNSYFEGIIHVQNGEVEISGSENTINGSIFGNTIKLSGSYINITAE